jgi:flagellar assembly protein FliH
MDFQIPVTDRKNNNHTNKTQKTNQKSLKEEATQLLEGALSEAHTIIENSKKEATEIILKAQEKKDKIKNQAFSEGYEQGYKKGLEEARKEQEKKWNIHMDDIKKIRYEIKKENETYKKSLEKECIKLSIKIAEKVLGRKIEEDGEYFIDLVKKGIEKAGEERNVSIRVSELDYEKVYPMIMNHQDDIRGITVIKDPFLCIGDCIIDGPNFEIDSSLRTQINNISTTLKELGVVDNDDIF